MLRYSFALLTLAAAPVAAQQGGLPPLRPQGLTTDTSIFAPLPWAPATATRTAGGKPGHAYWQNRADYTISATLDTAQRSLTGRLTLRYTNNSPDTLDFIWFQTEQNAFRANSLNGLIFPQDSRFGARGFDGGDVIDRFDQLVPRGKTTQRTALTPRDNGTMTKVDLARPLAPGATATFDIGWHFRIPEHGADRMGYDGALFELAQWYPRVAVYDDIDGWNTDPYLGQGEFYLEYGDYTLNITVPAGYIVAATGTLTNPGEVLTATQRSRLARAAKSDTTIRIITAAELASGAARPRATGTQTWKFHAENVRDAVWAASPEYQWDASSWQGHLAMAYYRPSATETWSDAADQARMSIEEYSERWFPYPWPHISAVEGPISGMEYPMIAMETRGRNVQDLYNVVTHEIGHMWYPMMVGSNERRHMWQDEGFNTFINTFSEGRRYPEAGDQMARAAQERGIIEQVMRAGVDQPIDIAPDRIAPNFLGLSAYLKPSVGLQLLRQEILGPEVFDDAFRTYTARWAFHHPTPVDFYRTMEDVAGRRLDWFWRGWFLENARYDQAVDTVVVKQVADSQQVTVVYGNRARGVLPIRALFTFDDGSTQEFRYPAEVWSTNSVHYPRSYRFMGKHLTRVELDPTSLLVDIDRSNNVWTKP
jgi:hypothetical protein